MKIAVHTNFGPINSKPIFEAFKRKGHYSDFEDADELEEIRNHRNQMLS